MKCDRVRSPVQLAVSAHSLPAFSSGRIQADNRRFFFPVRPIEVASFGVSWLFTRRGAAVLASELKWVWLPSGVLAAVALLLHA